jgi:hypothetical protein
VLALLDVFTDGGVPLLGLSQSRDMHVVALAAEAGKLGNPAVPVVMPTHNRPKLHAEVAATGGDHWCLATRQTPEPRFHQEAI